MEIDGWESLLRSTAPSVEKARKDVDSINLSVSDNWIINMPVSG